MAEPLRDAALRVEFQSPWRPIDAPKFDLRARFASVDTAVAYESPEGARALLVCASGVPPSWGPGLEELVFERASMELGRVLAFEVPRLQRSHEMRAMGWIETFEGKDGDRILRGTQVLGFHRERAELCVFGCVERSDTRACLGLHEVVDVSDWSAPPTPSAWLLLLGWAFGRPRLVISGIVVGLATMGCAVLRARPRTLQNRFAPSVPDVKKGASSRAGS